MKLVGLTQGFNAINKIISLLYKKVVFSLNYLCILCIDYANRIAVTLKFNYMYI